MLLKAGDILLFQGDSVTDCGRSREDDARLGDGYPKIISEYLKGKYPNANFRVINRGVSGDRAKDLEARWDADCLAIRPNVLTILIGINDTWRRFDRGDPTSAQAYRASYRCLLERVKNETDIRNIILIDPFVLPTPPDRAAWRDDLNPRIDIVRDLAREYGALYIPLDGLFAAASCERPCEYWAADGVHPTPDGHGLIADAWIRIVENH
ncbi:MAG: SGNH/GDSL hydrolase family protein [Oscillospiraceae bacterium]|jgi:lysophospholipase L1-like esterase|nr:SGNH/GDSL hydrolase family protein [Oscillospiraceae bacterium]